MRDGLKRWRDEIGDTYVLGLVRLAVGALLFYEALRAGKELTTNGYFGDVFHLAFLPEAFVPTRLVYTILVAAELILAALVVVGHRARAALLASAAIGLYVLLCDRLQFHHNRYTLLLVALLLSLSPCDRALVITGALAAPAARLGPLWAVRLVQAQLSLVYLASSLSKLVDDDWRSGLVIADRFARYGHMALQRGVPEALVEFFQQAPVTSGLAKLAIATELFLAIGLWQKRTRIFALWWGVMFHLTIEITSQVEIFTWLSLTLYALFVTPDAHARKLYFDRSRPRGVVYARLVQALDWLQRFEVKGWEPDALKKGHTIVVVRRDGSRATGIRALAMVARCVPLLFPLWAPLALLASFTKGGDTSSRV